MNNLIILFATLLISCTDNKGTGESNDATETSLKSKKESKEVDLSSDPLLDDEGDDVKYIYHEDALIPQLSKDSLKVLLSNSSDTVKLYGQRYDDRFLFEGDILINRPDTNTRGVATGVTTLSRKWPKTNGRLIVPYDIATDFPNPEKIQVAMRLWTDQAGVQFRQIVRNKTTRKTNEPNYIYFKTTKEGCFVNQIGKAGGEQPISLSDQCRAGNIAHEIGHILGLYHEQSRSDRDKYVQIDMTQIGGWVSQYKRATERDPEGKPVDIGEYDFYSIMHYPERSYFKVKQQYRGLPDGIPGQRSQLSRGDISAIKTIYSLP